MTEFGLAIRHLLDERGMSLRAVAVEAHWNAAYLSQVINGHRNGSRELARDLDRILSAAGQLTAIWEASQSPRLPGRIAGTAAASFTGAADSSPSDPAASAASALSSWQAAHSPPPVEILAPAQAGASEIEQLEAAVDMFRVWDHQRGGGLGRRAAIGQLADVADLLANPHPEPLRRRLLGVASRLSIIIGHMSSDAGLDRDAAAYLDLALDAARDADDGDLGAQAVNAIARRILDAGQPRDAVTLLRHARESLRNVRPSVSALLYTTEAWASARLGDYDEMALASSGLPGSPPAPGTSGRLRSPASPAPATRRWPPPPRSAARSQPRGLRSTSPRRWSSGSRTTSAAAFSTSQASPASASSRVSLRRR